MIAKRKQLIRQTARAARQGIPTKERASLSRAACERIPTLVQTMKPGTVLGYVASAEELDPSHALELLRKRSCRVTLPRVSGPGELTLHEISSGHDTVLEPGPYGIMQPCDSAPSVTPGEVTLVIVPGLSFDIHGRRLGYGGGYYDRLLAQMPHALLMGIAFDGQITEELPAEGHDIHMHVIVTPTRTIRPR